MIQGEIGHRPASFALTVALTDASFAASAHIFGSISVPRWRHADLRVLIHGAMDHPDRHGSTVSNSAIIWRPAYGSDPFGPFRVAAAFTGAGVALPSGTGFLSQRGRLGPGPRMPVSAGELRAMSALSSAWAEYTQVPREPILGAMKNRHVRAQAT